MDPQATKFMDRSSERSQALAAAPVDSYDLVMRLKQELDEAKASNQELSSMNNRLRQEVKGNAMPKVQPVQAQSLPSGSQLQMERKIQELQVPRSEPQSVQRNWTALCWAALISGFMAVAKLRGSGADPAATYWAAVAASFMASTKQPQGPSAVNRGFVGDCWAALAAGFASASKPSSSEGHSQDETLNGCRALPPTAATVSSAAQCDPMMSPLSLQVMQAKMEAKMEAKMAEMKMQMESRIRVLEEELHTRLKTDAGRIDNLEVQVSTWRHEQEFRSDIEEMKQELQECLDTSFHAMEAKVQETIDYALHSSSIAEAAGEAQITKLEASLADLKGRVETVEWWQVPSDRRKFEGQECLLADGAHGFLASSRLEKLRLADACAKIEQLENESLDAQSRMEELSVRLLVLKANQDAQDELQRNFVQRLDVVESERLEQIADIRSGHQDRLQELNLVVLMEQESNKVAEVAFRSLRREVAESLQQLRQQSSELQGQIADLASKRSGKRIQVKPDADEFAHLDLGNEVVQA